MLFQCFIALFLLYALPANAVEAISDLNLQTLTGATDSFTTTPPSGLSAPFNDPFQTWTVTADGNDLEITSVEVPTGPGNTDETYEFVRLADELRLRRIDNATVTGVRALVFCRGAANSGTFTIPCESTPLEDMDTILLGRAINFGTDNLFDNTTLNRNNIERADFIYESGLTVPAGAAGDVGFVVLERSGNDAFFVAAILSVDANFNPTSYGPLVSVTNQWGDSSASFTTVVFRRDPSDTEYRPTGNLGSQDVAGVFVTFNELVGASGTFYGYSIFPPDVGTDLLNLTDANIATSGGNGGLDLIEGGGFFQKDTATTTFVDIDVDKTTPNTTASANDTVAFTVTVSNLTQNVAVVDANVTDTFSADFTNVTWTCQAFGVGTSCNNGSTIDNGLPGPQQSGNIADVVDIAVGGQVVYEVSARLTSSVTGSVSNTATAAATGSQTDLSSANDTDTGSPALPSNFYGTPEYSLNGGPFGAAPATPPDYNPDITTVRIPMNGDMQTGSQFTLVYEGEAK